MLNESELEHYFSSALGRRIILCICQDEIPIDELSSAEKLRLGELKHELKRSAWLRGRQAIKTLLLRSRDEPHSKLANDLQATIPGSAGFQPAPTPPARNLSKQQLDTSLLSVPHPRLSLSHSGELAVAVACLDEAQGLGVDIELARPVKEGSTRFFLSEMEREWLSRLEAETKNDELLRLWTVKESLFKSDLANAGKTLLKYYVEDPSASLGKGFTSEQQDVLRTFTYCSRKLGDYWLTVTIAKPGENV